MKAGWFAVSRGLEKTFSTAVPFVSSYFIDWFSALHLDYIFLFEHPAKVDQIIIFGQLLHKLQSMHFPIELRWQ